MERLLETVPDDGPLGYRDAAWTALWRNIRADERLARLPIIMITSRLAEQSIGEGASEIGVRPLSRQTLPGRGTAGADPLATVITAGA